jgi:hypothetical protein
MSQPFDYNVGYTGTAVNSTTITFAIPFTGYPADTIFVRHSGESFSTGQFTNSTTFVANSAIFFGTSNYVVFRQIKNFQYNFPYQNDQVYGGAIFINYAIVKYPTGIIPVILSNGTKTTCRFNAINPTDIVIFSTEEAPDTTTLTFPTNFGINYLFSP